MAVIKRFRCPSCRLVLERPGVHGNTKNIRSYCAKSRKDVVLRRLEYRKAK